MRCTERNASIGRRASVRALVLLVSMLLGACGHFRGPPEPAITALVVDNHGLFDVNVYTRPSPLEAPVRLGMVSGGRSAQFPLHAHDLAGGGVLTVQLHAIGGRGSWTSHAVIVDRDVVARLDITTDAFGDCSRSSLYVVPGQ